MLQWKTRLASILALIGLITAAFFAGDLELFGWWW
jgi:hypothetical protein